MTEQSGQSFDVAIIGGGIVGIAAASAIVQRWPGRSLVVIDKEARLASHQTGRNSGVVHSGIYYKPGSFKARLCRAGNESIVRFCAEHGIAYERCGKLIVASDEDQIPRLDALRERAEASGIEAAVVGPEQIAEREPHVVGVRGLWLPSTGITDYRAIVDTLAGLVVAAGGQVRLETEVTSISRRDGNHQLQTTRGPLSASVLVNCAGLHSDRIARLAGAATSARIVPFRGEYFELTPSRTGLVNGLVYPVPDPNFPFLGVHFTKMIDGSVHAGPNAVLALAREGYRKRDVNLRDLAEVVSFPGFWRLARRHARSGLAEIARSVSKRRFLRSLQTLVPDVRLDDLVPAAAGIRAQLLERSGALVDDFSIITGDHAVHVCNAPSPAATSSLEIGRLIADELSTVFD